MKTVADSRIMGPDPFCVNGSQRVNNSNGFFIADIRKRKFKVCLSAIENLFELLI